jgi:hypothetical protein
MIKTELLDYFHQKADHRGLPHIKNAEWLSFRDYGKDDIRDSFAHYIVSNNVVFPLKEISEKKMSELFVKFANTSMLSEYKNFTTVDEKFDYVYKYEHIPLGVIDKSHAYNAVSNYFQQENRMRCGSLICSSPMDIWKDEQKLAKMNWHWWRSTLGNSDVSHSTMRSGFRIGTYTATQFKPAVAKALYEKHNARTILDTSCGWGDRLAGFYATPSTQRYVGCDPNPEVYETYKKQCIAYEKLLGGNPVLEEHDDFFICRGLKTVEIYNRPAEDISWKNFGRVFDFYFTSPPYFNTETYGTTGGKSDLQSWSRYDTFQKWRDNFFFKVNRDVWESLKDDAYMMINIVEPQSKGRSRHNLCDSMVEDILKLPKSNYVGKIGMRMMGRPHTKELKAIFIEPVWVFRKNNANYIQKSTSTLESLF